MSEGASIRTIVKADDMPSGDTIYRWIRRFPDFSLLYARAQNDRAHLIADEALEIADESNGDVVVDGDGVARFQGDNVQRARLRVDTRKWFAAKLAPRVYGESATLRGDPNAPIAVALQVDSLELARRVAYLLAAAEQPMVDVTPPPSLSAPIEAADDGGEPGDER